MPYPNEALTDVCTMLMTEYGLSLAEITNLATDLPGECEAIIGNHAEAAYVEQQARLMETGGPDDSAYRRQMTEAGRGHLLPGGRS